jgi:beta-glucanase (GH16 family)
MNTNAASFDASGSYASDTVGGTSLVPLAPVATYAVSSAEILQNGNFTSTWAPWMAYDPQTALMTSELRSGQALRASGWIGQRLSDTALQPGVAYSVTMTARKLADAGDASIVVLFRDNQNSVYRIYRRTIDSTSYKDFTLNFTAPAYVARPEVAISSNNVQTIVDNASMKMRAPIVQTEPVTSLEGSTVPAGYGLAFNDEFNGTSLNTDKWFTRYIYNGTTTDRLNDEQQRYRDNNNHIVSGGVLSLVARKVTDNDPAGINYESGMIRSDWTTRYGYIEARVKMPGGIGMWPAFWLDSDASENGTISWPPEIDIFEFVNNGVEDKTNMLHTGVVTNNGTWPPFLYSDGAFNQQWTFWTAPFNFNEGWHTIAAEWTPTTVTTYIDGQKIVTRAYQWNYNDGTLAGPAHILLNLAVGGQWAGRHGIDDSALPQSFQIDWVRAYKKLN